MPACCNAPASPLVRIGLHAVQGAPCSPGGSMQSRRLHAVQAAPCSPGGSMQSRGLHPVQGAGSVTTALQPPPLPPTTRTSAGRRASHLSGSRGAWQQEHVWENTLSSPPPPVQCETEEGSAGALDRPPPCRRPGISIPPKCPLRSSHLAAPPLALMLLLCRHWRAAGRLHRHARIVSLP
jgi:hypothetical protein